MKIICYFLISFLQGFLNGCLSVSATTFLLETCVVNWAPLTHEKLPYLWCLFIPHQNASCAPGGKGAVKPLSTSQASPLYDVPGGLIDLKQSLMAPPSWQDVTVTFSVKSTCLDALLCVCVCVFVCVSRVYSGSANIYDALQISRKTQSSRRFC